MPPVELALRTGAAAILLLTGIVILRDRRRMDSKSAGGLLALSVAADSIVAVSGGPSVPGMWPLVLIAMGTPAMLWIWVGAGFVDDFRPSWRDGMAWAILPAVGALGYAIGWRPWMKVTFDVVSLVFVALAAWRAVAGLRGDLVERRRRLRPVLAILTVLYAGGLIASQALDERGTGGGARRTDHTIEAALLAALAMAFGVLALRAGQPLFAGPVPQMQDLPADPPAALAVAAQDDAQEEALLARLRALMEDDKVYRQEGFGAATLVAALDVPEYRLRRLINHRLGHRNFPSFVNGYRLAEATAALADPGQADVPVLTIALDSGFQSIGPFNRAFKTHTGLTPTEYRKQAESRKSAPI
jgi:AraC-like DNA-binding protein